MDIRSLIPKNKFDNETAELLKLYSYGQIKPIVPDLLEWIQDMNWPVSWPVADYLVSIESQIINEIVAILKGDDEMWKYWCIGLFGLETNDIVLRKEIERIAEYPTKMEIMDGVQERAIEIMESWKVDRNP